MKDSVFYKTDPQCSISFLLFVFLFLSFGCASRAGIRDELKSIIEHYTESNNLACAALVLERPLFPEEDIHALKKIIEQLASEAREHAISSHSTKKKFSALSDFFFKIRGFTFDARHKTMTETLRHRSGCCYTLSLLYHEVAKRLGYATHIALLPGHVFVLVQGEGESEGTLNIETTQDGRFVSNKNYADFLAQDIPLRIRVLDSRQALALIFDQTRLQLKDHIGQNLHLEKLSTEYGNIACRLYPNFAEALLNSGINSVRKGQLQDAEEMIRRATDLEPKVPRAWFFRAIVSKALGRDDDVRKFVERGFAIKHKCAYWWVKDGKLLYAYKFLHKYVDQCWDRAIEIDENCNIAREWKCVCDIEIRDYNSVLRVADDGIRIDPESAMLFGYRGFALVNLGKIEKGLSDAAFALQHKPAWPFGWLVMGLANVALGNTAFGKECLQKAMSLPVADWEQINIEWVKEVSKKKLSEIEGS